VVNLSWVFCWVVGEFTLQPGESWWWESLICLVEVTVCSGEWRLEEGIYDRNWLAVGRGKLSR
jgi:hypothetical protein